MAQANAPRSRPPVFLRGGPEWRRVEKELKILREEEERPTLETVEGLKRSLCQVNRENVRKEAVIKRLTARLSKRRMGGEGGAVEQTEKRIAIVEDVGVNAVAIFPEEIWEMILDKVLDLRDRLNCYDTCALFRKLLHQWKTTWEFEQALPHLFFYVPTDKLFQCRLVSKGWKEAVDDSHRNHPSLRPHDEKTCNPRLHPFVNTQRERGILDQNRFCFEIENAAYSETPPDLKDPEYIQKTRRNLVMWRTANLQMFGSPDLYDEDEKNEFWNKIYTFMKVFGKDVWYLIVDVEIKIESSRTVQKLLQFLFMDLFTFVPSLRKLTIGTFNFWGPDANMEISPDPDSLPHLPYLETVESLPFEAGEGREYRPLFLAVVERYRTQLKRLKLDFTIGDGMWTQANQLTWQRITELHITVSSLNVLVGFPWMKLPNLAKLGLLLTRMADPVLSEDENFSLLLQILNGLSSSSRLSTLRLDRSIIKMLKRLGRTPMAARMPPSLKTLELNYSFESISPHPDYRFLLYFPHLENLNVFYTRHYDQMELALRYGDELEKDFSAQLPASVRWKIAEPDREQEVVEVNKFVYFNEMYKSNIWELLPRLKIFTFQHHVYTRGGNEDYRMRKSAIQIKKNEL